MSKKKAFSGSTMTLKDFHGGSIPSDLPLPSAPGVISRPIDRSGFDRQTPTAWGNPIGRSDHRARPGSSGATRSFDEKASLLSHPCRIGRNFDEDERKPLDGVSTPRRTVSDESIRVLPSRPEPKTDPVLTGKPSDGRVSSPVLNSPRASIDSHPVRHSAYSQITSGNNGNAVPSSYPNAWGTRKDVVAASEPLPSLAWSSPNAASKIARASAIEVVSSGRWQSKHLIHHQPDAEVTRFSGTEGEFRTKDNCKFNGMDLVNERGDYDVMGEKFASHIVEDGTRRSLVYSETKERGSPHYVEGVQQGFTDDKLGGSHSQSSLLSEVSERPKLKLLPRSRPLENLESSVVDYKQQRHQQPYDSVNVEIVSEFFGDTNPPKPGPYKQRHQQPYDSGHVEIVNEFYGDTNPPKPGSPGTEAGNRAVERPKLNLKPRTQPVERLEGNVERERNTLFGGARPRELVLKERGIEDVAINNLDPSLPPNRVKNELPKTEKMLEPVIQTARYNERAESLPHDQKIEGDTEKKDRPEHERTDMQKRNWRNENWRNAREMEKQQRQPEPGTWRKPVEQPNPVPADTRGLRYGKAASALELAQAFSKSISDAKTPDNVSGQRGTPERNQMPFSRLTDTREFYTGPGPRRQINGY